MTATVKARLSKRWRVSTGSAAWFSQIANSSSTAAPPAIATTTWTEFHG